MIHPTELSDDDLLKTCSRQNYRDSGPGGQHRNKVETGIELKHHDTGIVGRASERRQQSDNLRMALKRLRLQLALDCRSSWETPSELWRSRLSGQQIQCRADHRDFANLLSEALNVLELNDFNIKESAALLQVSSSQLFKFLKKEPRAFERLNSERQKRGLSKIK